MARNYVKYSELKKPTWAPPSCLFGPVWSVLYIVIAVSFVSVFLNAFKADLSWFVALPFILNLIFNFLFTPLQFRLKNNLLAAIDIALVLLTLIWALIVIYPYFHWIALANIPYLLWVSFATILQFTVTYLNRKK